MADGNWKYGRRQPACPDCEREFEDGEAHLSFLTVDEEAQLERVDLCEACWKARGDEQPEIWWRARRRIAERRGLAVDMEALEAVFHQLGGREEESHRELRYVLCLLLMRKRRVLMNRAIRRKDGEFMLVRRPRRKEDIEVEVFDLAPERMDSIRVGLQRLFEGEDAASDVEEPSEAAGEQDGEPSAARVEDATAAEVPALDSTENLPLD